MGDSVSPVGTTTLPITIGEELKSKTLMVSFIVVALPSTYNAIIGRPTLNKLRAVVSTYHQIMKFLTRARVREVRSDPRESRQCYLTTITLPKKLKASVPTLDDRDSSKISPKPEPVEKVVEEWRAVAHLWALEYKKAVARLYNHKVCPREIKVGDLMLRKAEVSDPTRSRGKLSANWEGPYRVETSPREDTFTLVTMEGKRLPRTWHISNLRKFYV
ncbi:hypothetical protein BHE74_00004482 [Ensete ventricosum]|nr:hypothetical protein BHE74_00004482 [Ensete ventricosum]